MRLLYWGFLFYFYSSQSLMKNASPLRLRAGTLKPFHPHEGWHSLRCLDVFLLLGCLQAGLNHLQELNQHRQDPATLHNPCTRQLQLLQHKQ